MTNLPINFNLIGTNEKVYKYIAGKNVCVKT